MGTVTAVSFSCHWRVPVHVAGGGEAAIEIAGPADALRYMSEFFHFKSGPHYCRTQKMCHSALVGELNPELVRGHFLAACADEATKGNGQFDA